MVMKQNKYIIKIGGVVKKAEVDLSCHEDSIQNVMKENEYIDQGKRSCSKSRSTSKSPLHIRKQSRSTSPLDQNTGGNEGKCIHSQNHRKPLKSNSRSKSPQAQYTSQDEKEMNTRELEPFREVEACLQKRKHFEMKGKEHFFESTGAIQKSGVGLDHH